MQRGVSALIVIVLFQPLYIIGSVPLKKNEVKLSKNRNITHHG